ncbi:hypothetical protein KKG61_09045 [bacterium]|nr:hypothetical protein [bacterium]MBU2461272.1 hypothetical protein [bacterium]
MGMTKTVMRDPITQRELPVIMENGKPKAVVIDIERFNALTKLLDILNEQDTKEAILLSQSEVAKAAIGEGMASIKQGKITPWRQALEKI